MNRMFNLVANNKLSLNPVYRRKKLVSRNHGLAPSRSQRNANRQTICPSALNPDTSGRPDLHNRKLGQELGFCDGLSQNGFTNATKSIGGTRQAPFGDG